MKSLRMGSILLALCEIVVGILLLINPVGFTSAIITFLGVVLAVGGIVSVVRYFRAPAAEAALEQDLAKGLIEIVLGVFCVVKSGWFINMFPVFTVLYGILTLVTGFSKVQWTADMIRIKAPKWGWMALNAALTLIFAVVILMNPFTTTEVLWMFIAIVLIVEAVVDVVVAIFAKPIV